MSKKAISDTFALGKALAEHFLEQGDPPGEILARFGRIGDPVERINLDAALRDAALGPNSSAYEKIHAARTPFIEGGAWICLRAGGLALNNPRAVA
jgi:hypothetical protein